VIETIWDVASIVYDVGKITVGVVTDNPALVADGFVDLGTDAIALVLPGVPAGASKVVRIVRNGKAAEKALKEGTEVAIKVSKTRAKKQINSTAMKKGDELVDGVTKIYKQDVTHTSVKVTVKKNGQECVTAELDMIIKDNVLELKNWSHIRPSDAKTFVAQIERQQEVTKAFGGTHGGLVIGETTTITGDALKVFSEKGIQVYRKVEGELKAVIKGVE